LASSLHVCSPTAASVRHHVFGRATEEWRCSSAGAAMSDDFDEKMNALMGRMNAWKQTRSTPTSPMPGESAFSQDNAQPQESTAGVTVVTPGGLPATPDFQTRPSVDFEQRRSVDFEQRRSLSFKYSDTREDSEQGTSIDSYRDDFNIRVSDFQPQPRRSIAPRASVGALGVLRDVLSSIGGGDGGDAAEKGSAKSSLSVSILEEAPERRTSIAFEPAASEVPSVEGLAPESVSAAPNSSSPSRASFTAPRASISPPRASISPPRASISAPRASIMAPRASIWASSPSAASGSLTAPTGSLSADPGSVSVPTGSVSPAPGNSISSAPGGPAAPGDHPAVFHHQMNALESKMLQWKNRATERLKSPLSPVIDTSTRQSLMSSAVASAPESPLDTQNDLAEPQPEAPAPPSASASASAPAGAPASAPAPTPAPAPASVAAPPSLKKRPTLSSNAIQFFAAAQQAATEDFLDAQKSIPEPQPERSLSLEAPSTTSATATFVAAPATAPAAVAAKPAFARRSTVAAAYGGSRPISPENRAVDRRQSLAPQAMSKLVPDEVWESKAPAHHTSYAFLSGMSSTRSAYSYAETVPVTSPAVSPVASNQPEESEVFKPRASITNFSVRSGYSSLNSSASAPVTRTPPPEGIAEMTDVVPVPPRGILQPAKKSPQQRAGLKEQALEVAGNDPLSQRVSSLEDSMQNIERLLRYLVKENPEVRDAVRPRRSKAKLLTPAESGALEALQSTLGAEPEHEPTWFGEQTQRSKMRASLRASSDSRVHAALRPPGGKRADRKSIRLDPDVAASLEAVEATATREQSNEEEDEDPDAPVRRGRFHWPLNIHRAREELRAEVRKELSARWQ